MRFRLGDVERPDQLAVLFLLLRTFDDVMDSLVNAVDVACASVTLASVLSTVCESAATKAQGSANAMLKAMTVNIALRFVVI